SSVTPRVEELIGMPACGAWPRFSFAVAYDTTRDQIRIVEHCSKSVQQRVAQLSAFVNRTRSIRRCVAGNAARPGELREQMLQPCHVLRHLGIELRIGTFKIGIRYNARPAMARTGNVDGIQLIFLDHPVHVRPDEIQSRRCAPMSEKARLYMLQFERLAKKRIIVKVNLSDGQIVGSAPVTLDS